MSHQLPYIPKFSDLNARANSEDLARTQPRLQRSSLRGSALFANLSVSLRGTCISISKGLRLLKEKY